MIWGLNFNETQTRTVTLSIPDQLAGVATLKHLGVSGGTTSLMSYLNLAWNQQDVTTSLRAENFDFVMPPAQITLLILQISPAARADFDGDGDVDQSDFGHLQACLSGSTVPQNDPICQDAQTQYRCLRRSARCPGLPVMQERKQDSGRPGLRPLTHF